MKEKPVVRVVGGKLVWDDADVMAAQREEARLKEEEERRKTTYQRIMEAGAIKLGFTSVFEALKQMHREGFTLPEAVQFLQEAGESA